MDLSSPEQPEERKDVYTFEKRDAKIFAVAFVIAYLVVGIIVFDFIEKDNFQKGYVCAFDTEHYSERFEETFNIFSEIPTEYCLEFNEKFLEAYEREVIR